MIESGAKVVNKSLRSPAFGLFVRNSNARRPTLCHHAVRAEFDSYFRGLNSLDGLRVNPTILVNTLIQGKSSFD